MMMGSARITICKSAISEIGSEWRFCTAAVMNEERGWKIRMIIEEFWETEPNLCQCEKKNKSILL